MASASQDSLLPVVIRPFGTMSPPELKFNVLSRFPTRAEQHREIVSALMKTSEVSQKTVLGALKSPELGVGVEDVRGYWIDNIITARLSKAAITTLSSRTDIERIQPLPTVSLVTPLSAGTVQDPDHVITQNQIRAIKADSVWMAGYTGKGRLVGSLDTGVDGKHFMLTNNWRGHNGGTVDASWHDPVYGDSVPRYFAGTGGAHGTQVMGLMVAVIPGINDTVGVCPDCEWISAAAIDIPCPTNLYAPCGNLFDALQWIADPDGDPNTDWDAPDAVANPWGAVTKSSWDGCQSTGFGCSDLFWNAIDNIEAAGTMMVFAAGNEGACGAMSMRNPANRVSSETNAFSVGMVDARTNIANPPVDPLSSRGPSDCDGTSIKPELTAPGVNLRTTTLNDGVNTSAYGTSFSTPLVAAGAAVLREYNPNATVDQLKSSLLAGAKDLGTPGPDNSNGHGLLDLMESLRQLPPNTDPAVYVMRDEYDPPAPGTNADILFVLRNCGTPATGVGVSLSTTDPKLMIVDGHSSFADMVAYGDSADNASDPFEIAVHALCVPGERLSMTIEISADGGYSRTIGGAILVGPPNAMSVFTHDAGNFQMTVGAAGTFGHPPDGIAPRPNGIGYLYDGDPVQTLFDGAFMIGAGPSQISDNARDESGSSDVDFRIGPGGLIFVQEPAGLLAEEARSAFDDSYAENPIGLFIEQRSMASDLAGHGDYLIVEYTIHNRSGQMLENLHCGLFFDWDFPWTGDVATRDGGGFDAANGVGWMRHREENRFRGVSVLSETPLSGYKFFSNLNEIYDGFSEAEKWSAMTGGTAHAIPVAEGDGSHTIGAGPFALGFGESTKVAFAVIGGIGVPQLLESARLAKLQYDATFTTLAVDILPGACPNELSNWDATPIEYLGRAKARPMVTGVSVAILGGEGFDASIIDPLTVRLAGLAPVGSRYEDISTPLLMRESGVCECNRSGADGHRDLVLTFDKNDIDGLVAVGEPPTSLTLTAQTHEKVSVLGSDCLRIVNGPITPSVVRTRHSKARLGLNSPNPFNASTQIEVSIESTTEVHLEIFDVLGRRVRVLVDNNLSPGRHEFLWDGRADGGATVASGVYFARLASEGDVQVSKLVLLK